MAGAQGAKGKKKEQGELWVRGAGRPDQAGPSPQFGVFPGEQKVLQRLSQKVTC